MSVRPSRDPRVIAIVLAMLAGSVATAAAHVGGPSAGRSADRAASPSPRPSPSPSPSPASTPSPSPPSPSASPGLTVAVPIPAPTYVFPVRPIRHARFGHTHHDYPATDIFAPCGDSFVAPTSGTITEFRTVDTWVRRVNDGATRGGLSVTLVGDDGVRYYGSHLRSVSTLLTPGLHVDAGTLLGRVGDTGDAKGLGCHVHFGISSPQCGIDGDWWIRRGRLYPWPYLESWRGGGRRSPALTVQSLPLSVGCPALPPGVRIKAAG